MQLRWWHSGCGGGGVPSCDGGVVVAVERVCSASMVASGCGEEGVCAAATVVQWLRWRECATAV